VGTGGSYPELKRQRYEADHSLSSGAKVKDGRSYTSTLPYVFMAWYLVKNRDRFTISDQAICKFTY
jgi:hypothetical protein